jgi:hypothetical protein
MALGHLLVIIVADFRKGDFDPFLESVMFNSWSTTLLKLVLLQSILHRGQTF